MNGFLALFAEKYNFDEDGALEHQRLKTPFYLDFCKERVEETLKRRVTASQASSDDDSSSSDDDEIKAPKTAKLTALVIDYAKEFGLTYDAALEEEAALLPRYDEFKTTWMKKEIERLAKKPKPKPRTKPNQREKEELAAQKQREKEALAAQKQREKEELAAQKQREKEAKEATKKPSANRKKKSSAFPSFNYVVSKSDLDPDTLQHMRFALFCKMQEQFPRGINVEGFLSNSQYDHLNDIIQALYEFAHYNIPLSKEMLTFLQKDVKFYNKPIPTSNECEMSSYMKFGIWARRQIVDSNVDSIIRLFRLNKLVDVIDEFVLNPTCDDNQSVRSNQSKRSNQSIFQFDFDSSQDSSRDSSQDSSDEDDYEDLVHPLQIGAGRWVEEYNLPRSLSMQVQVGTPHNDTDVMNTAFINHEPNEDDIDSMNASFDVLSHEEGNEVIDNEVIDNEVIDNEVIDNEVIDNEVIDNDVIDNDVIGNEVIDNEVIDNDVIDNEVIDNEGFAAAADFNPNLTHSVQEPLSLDLSGIEEEVFEEEVFEELRGKRKPDFHDLRVYQETVALLSKDDVAHLSVFQQNVAYLFKNRLEEVPIYVTNVRSFVDLKKKARFI